MAKAASCQRAYQLVGEHFAKLEYERDGFTLPSAVVNQRGALEPSALLNKEELMKLFQERDRLREDLREASERLKQVAPHLI